MEDSWQPQQRTSHTRALMLRLGAETTYEGRQRLCYCGRLAPRWTSWTERNPGRRFYGCPDYSEGGCGFFAWHDDDVDDRWKVVINHLVEHVDLLYAEKVRRINDEKEHYSEERKQLLMMKKKLHITIIGLALSWLIFLYVIYC